MRIESAAFFLLCSSLVAPPAAAQTETPTERAPRLLLQIVCDGPAAWRAKFAPTNLGTMLASEEGGRLWKPRLEPFDAALRRVLASGQPEPDAAAARARWLDYGGRVEFVLASVVAPDDAKRLSPCALLRFHGDARTDLDALAADLSRQLAANNPFARVVHEDREWQASRFGKLFATAPLRVGEAVVIHLGEPGTLAASERLAANPAPAAIAGTTLRVVAHAQEVDAHLSDVDAEIAASWRALGFGAVREMSFAIGTAGPFVQIECAAAFGGEDRGVFGAFFPATTGIPPLLQLVPADGTPWKVGHFDVAAMWRTGCSVVDAVVNKPAGTAAAAVAKAWGVDPLADVFEHMHDDYAFLGSPGWSMDDGFVEDGCIVFRLRDEAKFAAGFERMRQNWKPHVQKASEEEHEGVTITHYSNLLVPVQVAIGRGLVFVAIGRDGADRIRDSIDRATTAASADPGEAWRPALRHAPAGVNGIGQIDLRRVLRMYVATVFAIAGFLPDNAVSTFLADSGLEEFVEGLEPLLERHGLTHMRTATGFDAGRWAFRMFW
jgi:hypothetical protein